MGIKDIPKTQHTRDISEQDIERVRANAQKLLDFVYGKTSNRNRKIEFANALNGTKKLLMEKYGENAVIWSELFHVLVCSTMPTLEDPLVVHGIVSKSTPTFDLPGNEFTLFVDEYLKHFENNESE